MSDRPPGVLAYRDGQAIGWCSIAPRSEFGRLLRSPLLRPLDDQEVWSIVCLFVNPAHRRSGVSRALIEGAVKFAASHGARIVEAYPIEPRKDPMPDLFAFTGIASVFAAAGFVTAGQRKGRPIVRRSI